MSPLPYVSIRSLAVAYQGNRGQPALADISIDLSSGGRLALIGESGSGKSTLALAIAGLLPAEAQISGTITFPDLGREPVLGRDIGVVFQDPSGSLDPIVTVGEQIAEVAVVHLGLSWREARVKARDLLDRVGFARISDAMTRYPHELSGGQRQRVALAAALAGDPSLLIADEPTSALDTVIQRDLIALLDSLVREEGLTLLFVTHDIALASELGDEVMVLLRGRCVEAGPVARVLRVPVQDYTKALLATHLQMDTPIGQRLPEIDPSDFSVKIPVAR